MSDDVALKDGSDGESYRPEEMLIHGIPGVPASGGCSGNESDADPPVEYAMSFVLQSAIHRGHRGLFNGTGELHEWDDRLHSSHERAFISACQFLQEYFHVMRLGCVREVNQARLDSGYVASGGVTGGDAEGTLESQ